MSVLERYLTVWVFLCIVAGLILLAAALCTAMIFVWSCLTDGDPLFTLSQVALNDTIMVVAFAPLAGLLMGICAITVPWGTLIASVVLHRHSGAALATVVDVLIEVPVMLLVVSVVNRSKGWYEHTGRRLEVKS